MTRYKEIFELRKMLEEAKIPFGFLDRNRTICDAYTLFYYGHCVPNKTQIFKAKYEVLQGVGSVGYKDNLLEIRNLESKGFTVEEAFRIIKEDWENDKF